jgi:23S rRNA pseudouridine2457 synthase
VPDAAALRHLENGVLVQGRKTLPCVAQVLDPQPEVPEREPPIRFRKTVPTCWISLQLIEGKNRQVRKMTAIIGHPTLRLMRVRIGQFGLESLKPGEWRELTETERSQALNPSQRG